MERDPETQWPLLYLDSGETLECRLLVGADGAMSKVREFMGVEAIGWDYNQKGIVATLKIQEGVENNTAWQRFLPSGPIALLPV